MKREPYATEVDLCADFLKWVEAEAGSVHYGVTTPRWTAYAETAGWDILLVAEDGTQIGVQAKLKFNMKVLSQTLPDHWAHWHDIGPDYRAVLVPDLDSTHADICGALGLMLFARSDSTFSFRTEPKGPKWKFSPGLNMNHSTGWHYWSPHKRSPLPDYVPDVPAGASGPVQLTKWKIGALRIVAVLELRGHVTREDFRAHQIDPRRWTGPAGWLQSTDIPGRYVRGPDLDFDKQHPTIYAQVLAEERKRLIV